MVQIQAVVVVGLAVSALAQDYLLLRVLHTLLRSALEVLEVIQGLREEAQHLAPLQALVGVMVQVTTQQIQKQAVLAAQEVVEGVGTISH